MDLTTTNVLLGIMAVVSLIEGLVIIGLAWAGFRLYRQAQLALRDVEARYVQPLGERVNAVLDDVKAVSARVSAQADRVDGAIRTTIDRVDVTADRMRHGVHHQVNRVVGLVRGVRTALNTFVNGHVDGNGTDGRSAGADRSVSATGL